MTCKLKLPKVELDPFKKAFRFLRQFVDPRNYFEGIYHKNGTKNWYPKQTEEDLIRNQNNFKRKFKNINQQLMLRHFAGALHIGYCNSYLTDSRFHLLCIDVDFYEFDEKLAIEAKALVESLLTQAIYWESSTSGKGLHGYIVIDKGNHVAGFVRRIGLAVEKVFSHYAREIGLKGIDICGLPCSYQYANSGLVGVKFSTPAKLPREHGRIQDLIDLPVLSFAVIRDIEQKNFDIAYGTEEETSDILPFVPVASDDNKSTSMKYYGFSSIVQKIQADVLNEWNTDRIKIKQRYVYSSHMSVYLYILYFLKKAKVQNVSWKLIEWHWNNLQQKGLTDLNFNVSVLIWCRNYASSKNMIEWIDNQYCMSVRDEEGTVLVKGKCCKFQMDSTLFSSLNKAMGGELFNATNSFFRLKLSGQDLRPVYNAKIRFAGVSELKLAG